MKNIATRINQLLPNSILQERIRNQYGERLFFYYDLGDDTTETYSSVLFGRQFNNQISLMTYNMCMMYKGFTAEYDPTSNYDMKEAHYSGSKTGETTTTVTPTGQTTTTVKPTGGSTVRTSEATIDGTEKVVSTVTNTPTTDSAGQLQVTTIDKDGVVVTTSNKFKDGANQTVNWGDDNGTTEQFNTITKDETRRTGNIGVSTVPDMLLKETEVRFLNYLYTVIDRIIKDLTVMVYTGD